MKLPLFVAIIALAVVAVVGIAVTDFPIYLGDDPTACNNCHVMDAQYEGWIHGTHSTRAHCSDCHAPHDSLIVKYLYKGYAGAKDALFFTLDEIPEPLRARQLTKDIIQRNCIHCHSETVADVVDGQMESGRYCFDCHRSVAHGDRGISLLPYQDKGEKGIAYPLEEMNK